MISTKAVYGMFFNLNPSALTQINYFYANGTYFFQAQMCPDDSNLLKTHSIILVIDFYLIFFAKTI
jgi:hypothetical protein